MANQASMDGEVDKIRRRTWAPFVGAALAALTAGSLVVFALVAQRTSLDGFPELRIATPANAAPGSPDSITVAPLGRGITGTSTVASDDDADPSAIAGAGRAALPLIPFVAATTPSAPVDLADLDNAAGTPRPRTDEQADFDGRFRADGVVLASSRNGKTGESGPGPDAAGKDGRDGKRAGRSHGSKGKKHKTEKHGRARRSGGRPSTDASSDRGRASSAGSRSNGSQAAPSSPRPQPSPQGPPAHSNAGGNGKSHGKGHKKH